MIANHATHFTSSTQASKTHFSHKKKQNASVRHTYLLVYIILDADKSTETIDTTLDTFIWKRDGCLVVRTIHGVLPPPTNRPTIKCIYIGERELWEMCFPLINAWLFLETVSWTCFDLFLLCTLRPVSLWMFYLPFHFLVSAFKSNYNAGASVEKWCIATIVRWLLC